jgi:hypothetical protein
VRALNGHDLVPVRHSDGPAPRGRADDRSVTNRR